MHQVQDRLQRDHLLRRDPRRQPPEVLPVPLGPPRALQPPEVLPVPLALPRALHPPSVGPLGQPCCTISPVSRILVVDDDDQLRRALRINLAARAYEVL